MTKAYPEFQVRLPHGGPLALGRLLDEKGDNGSQKFVIRAGSPIRAEVVPSLPARMPSVYRYRQRLIADGRIRESSAYHGYLEAVEDLGSSSPSAAANIVLGRPSNGYLEWKTAEGRPLADYLESPRRGRNRAWLVRGSNVAGFDLVQRLWLQDGLVTLPASRLRDVREDLSKNELRSYVEEDYGSTLTFNQQNLLVDELYAFFVTMKPGDKVCTISGGLLYVGEIIGDAWQVATEGDRSSLRRPVDWSGDGYPWEELPEELQQRLSIQHDVVDLTLVEGLILGLGRTDEELVEEIEGSDGGGSSSEIALIARRELALPEVTSELAEELLVHDVEWLRELRELLWDDRQLVLYGPPGTGKTYIALELARYLAREAERVALVQFHPSYSYEDFFEGFRPREDPRTGEVAFRITDGPLRELVNQATREGHRHVPYFLVIDEINRANLAKVFGELYFLLEYRNRSVRLTYSGEDFVLPPNLFIIGTMNTADRSIALIDSAMRRRFSFVELSPRTEPTKGLLRRWLAREGHPQLAADLLDALNTRINDRDFQIGPSYLMRDAVYRPGGLECAWRTKILPLLEEYHYGDDVDVEWRYGINRLGRDVGSATENEGEEA